MIAHNKIAASILVLAGFALWMAGTRVIGEDGPWKLAPSYGIGAISFILVACFLPDLPKTTFLSRRSALGLAGLLACLASGDLFRNGPLNMGSNYGGLWYPFLSAGLPIILGLCTYHLSLFLIRGFRARPEYKTQGEQGGVPNDR